MSLKNAFAAQSSITCGRGCGDLILEAKEEVLLEEDTTIVLQILLVEVKIIILVSQVFKDLINHRYKDLINHRYNVIIVKRMDIMHMNAGINNMTRISKVKIIQVTLIIPPTLCLWHVLGLLKQFLITPQLNVILSKKSHVTYGI